MNVLPDFVGLVGFVAVPPALTVWLATLLPPSVLNSTVYFANSFHLATNVIFFVTFELKLYLVLSKYHPSKAYPDLVGLVGCVAVLFSIILCEETLVPPSLLNLTSYLLTLGSSLHFATNVIFLLTSVLKSYFLLFRYHPSRIYPSFFTLVGSVALPPTLTDLLATLLPPLELNFTV